MSPFISGYARWLRAAGSPPPTVERRCEFLDWADRHLPGGLAAATTDQLADLFGRHTWAAWTRYTYHNHLRGWCRWAVLMGHLDADPSAGLRRPPRGPRTPHPITNQQLRLLLTSTPPPWPLVFLLAAYAGLRASEIAGLCRQDVNEIRIRVYGKGGRVRTVDTHPLIWAAVRELGDGPVVHDGAGAPMTGRQLSMRTSAMLRRLGLRGVRLHRGRHWFATSLLEAGADLVTVQQLMGHASVATTTNYTLVVDSRRAQAVNALPVVGHQAAPSGLVPPPAGRAA